MSEHKLTEFEKLAEVSLFAALEKAADVVLKMSALMGLSSILLSLCRAMWICTDHPIERSLILFAGFVAICILSLAIMLGVNFFGDWRDSDVRGASAWVTVTNITIFIFLFFTEVGFAALLWFAFLQSSPISTCA